MTPVDVTTDHVRRAAGRLREADARRTPCLPVRDLIGADDVDAAYAVQRLLTQDRLNDGISIVGHKVGLTSPAVQAQLGVDQPDFGMLFDDMDCPDGQVSMQQLLQPKVEAEVAFVLAHDLDDSDLGERRVRTAVAYATPALEIVDSRITGWDISFGDTVADNASSARYVLGDERLDLSHYEPVNSSMSMTLDGQTASTGNGAACLGDPLNALAWLARTARDLGEPLRAGHVVLSGALGPMVTIQKSCVVRAEISALGEVTASFL
jgi:2-keto-4-pentenoate hydratase